MSKEQQEKFIEELIDIITHSQNELHLRSQLKRLLNQKK
jgi:uncharacterized coiled-coil protein SlyX